MNAFKRRTSQKWNVLKWDFNIVCKYLFKVNNKTRKTHSLLFEFIVTRRLNSFYIWLHYFTSTE